MLRLSIFALLLIAAPACSLFSRQTAGSDPGGDADPMAATEPRRGPAQFASATSLERPPEDIKATFLLVQVPSDQRARTTPLWNYLHEDFVDAETQRHLNENGVRVGRGDLRDWPAIKANLDSIDGVLANPQAPIALKPNWPLGLELDSAPHDQTLFVVGADGILSGDSWPASRNYLRVISRVHPESVTKMRLEIVPEVRRRGYGWRWVRDETGQHVPQEQYSGRAFATAGFTGDLSPGEFFLIAPGAKSGAYGIVGGAFLTTEANEKRLDYLIFIRVDNNDDRSF